MNTTIYIV